MSKRYTISQLAHAADIPTTTVRYYERVGLVEPEDRSAGNYRLYSEESHSIVNKTFLSFIFNGLFSC